MESKSIAVRLSVDVITKLDEIAKKQFISRGTMLQAWIRERVGTRGAYRLETKRIIQAAGRDFFEQMHAANSELGNIAGEFMSLNVDYVLVHQEQEETYRTVHIIETGFSRNQKKYLKRLEKQLPKE